MTADAELRALERAAREHPEARYRYRCACVRAGVPERAGLEAGDRTVMPKLDALREALGLAVGWVPTRPVTVRVVSVQIDHVTVALYSSGRTTVAPRVLERDLVLVEPRDPSKARRVLQAALPPGRWRNRFRPFVRTALEHSFVFGWPLPEVRAYLRAVMPNETRGATWTRQAWAAEVGALTGNALGRGSRTPAPEPPKLPMFDRGA